MVFKDLVGFPMWETQLYQVLEPVFPELQLIFLHYRGASVQGTASIGNATKLGLMEMLDMAKDTEIATANFKIAELERQFHTANNQEALQVSGSADRNTGGTRQGFGRRTAAGARAVAAGASAVAASPRGRGNLSARAPRKDVPQEKVRPRLAATAAFPLSWTSPGSADDR